MSFVNIVALLGAFLLVAAEAAPFPLRRYRTHSFASPIWQISKTGTTQPGLIFYTPSDPPNSNPQFGPMITSENGTMVWHAPGGPALISRNARVQNYNGAPVISYWGGYGAARDPSGHSYGWVTIMNQQYQVIANVCMSQAETNIKTRYPEKFPGPFGSSACFLDSHESLITDRGTLLATAYNYTTHDLRPVGGSQNGYIWDGIFYEIEIPTKRILFRWRASDHINILNSKWVNPGAGPKLRFNNKVFGVADQPWDFFHINSIQAVPGGYIISSKHTFSVYMINGQTGEVEWTLDGRDGGDFTFDQPAYWNFQHMARMAPIAGSWNPSRLTLFDNAVGLGDTYRNISNGVSMVINTATKRVTSVRKLVDNAQPIYAPAGGSYQTLINGGVFLGYGSAPYFKEFNAQNRVVYTAKFADTAPGAPPIQSYRAYKQAWKATPAAPPRVVFSRGDNAVFMSWNGATSYTGWNIFAGTTQNNLRLVKRNVLKKTFETRYNFVVSNYRFVKVQVLQDGRALRNSSVVQAI